MSGATRSNIEDWLASSGRVAWVLTLVMGMIAAGSGQQGPAGNSQALSREFMLSATGALASIHSLKQNMVDVISKNLPGGYYNRDQAVRSLEKVREAQVNARTQGDQATAELLNAYARKLQTWGEQYKSARQSMNATNTLGENDVTQDPDLQAINACEQALNSMLKQGSYNSDVTTCQ